MIKKLNGLKITYNDDRFLKEVIKGGEYSFISYYPTIVDIGANIGAFSLYMYDHAEKIYAVEPSEENLNCLKQTIKDNNLDKIIPIQMAISDHSWISYMQESGAPGGGGWRLSETGDIPVDTRTLLDLMESQNIDFIDLLKIDTEGEEIKILGSQYFPSDKVGTIIGEIHNQDAEGIQKLLNWYGYRCQIMPNGHFLARK